MNSLRCQCKIVEKNKFLVLGWMNGWMDGWKINLAEFFLIKLHIHPKRIERESAKVIMG